MRLKQCIFALMAMLLCAFSANAQGGSVAKIGDTEYTTFAEAMAAANATTGNVDVEVYGAVEFVDGMELNGSYTTITFTGKSTGAKITINQTAGGDYLTAHGKTVAFNGLILAKANPAWSGNSGHMGNYFSIQGGTVTYTDCTFPNGACTNTGTAVYNNCTFQNSSEYGLWVYDDALVTVNGGTIDSKKGIKVYSEGEQDVTSTLTVQNATFTENVTAKPAVAVGYAQSITLIGNTYNNPTAHVELDSGSDADCEGITFVAQDSEGNDIVSTLKMTDRSNSSAPCGVLVGGKIYTTVTEAAAEATEGSTVTLLYDSTEEVELPEGVTLNKNGYIADNVTVATSGVAQVGENVFTTVLEALQYAINNNAAELKILCDVREKMTTDFDLIINADLTITADAPVKVEFYNDGTSYDFAVGSNNNNTLTIGENVHFDLVDRVIWLGYWGNNVTVVVNGYLGGYQIWHGANTVVNGTLDSHGEAFIMRRDATLTANEGAKVNANYFQIYSGHIVAENATITAGLVWVNNNHNYGNEGTVSFELDNTEFTSNGEVKIYAGEGKIVSVTLENSSSFDAKGVVTLGDNVKVVADATSSIQDANGPVVIPVAKIGSTTYATFAEALTAASAMSGDVTIEVYDKVTLNTAFSGSYSSINFVGKDTDAEIYLDVQGYITATGKKVSFTDLTLSKSAGAYITNAGFMNVAFGIYDVTEVAYTNCKFANGAYASSGNVTFKNCTFYRSYDKYGLWAYGNVAVAVEGCIFADYRGIKMYAEGAAKTVDLTVKNTNFSALTGKPAIVLTYGESVVLEGNTYSSTGTFELDKDGAPNGTAVTSDVAPTCMNDYGTCGVLVDGKIYTTVAQAAAVATEGSNVTLLYSTTDAVEFAEGVNLTLANGVIADNVTVATSGVAKIGETAYATLEEAFKAATSGCTIDILSDVTVDYAWDARYTGGKFTVPVTINGNGKTIKFTASVNDNNYQAPFRFEADATVNNLIVDMSEVTDNRFRAISSKGNLTVDGCKFIGKDESLNCRAIIFGEGAGANVGNLAIAITNSEFINWKRGITDNENGQDVKSVTVTGNTLKDAAVYVSANETVTFTGNTVEGAYVNINSYTTGNTLNVTATGNTLAANTGDACNSIQAGGTVDAQGEFVVPAKGSNSFAYTKEENGYVRVWGEGGGNAKESYELKLYSGETLIATTKLNNVDNVINGDVYVTWNFYYPQSTDEYWTTTWEAGHPNSAAQPTEVELYIDGTLVATTAAKMSGADDVAPVVWRNLGGVAIANLLGEGTAENPYLIETLKDLKFFRDDVNAGNTYAGKTVKVINNIDLNSEAWTPIATFNGVFDGNDKTISNLVVNGEGKSNQGFFGQTNNGEIKNLTINNATVKGRLNVGVVAGTPYTSKYTNIKVTGDVVVEGMAYVGGVGGKNAYANWTDVTVDVNSGSYVKATSTEGGTAYRTYVGGVVGFNGEGGHTFKNISSNIKVIGDVCDIGGIFGIAHYSNNFENVTFSGSVEAAEGAKEVGGIAGVWNNTAGYTVTFTNCAVADGATVMIGTEDVTEKCAIVGGAYTPSNNTAANSGSLIIDGKEAWIMVAKVGEQGYPSLADALDAAAQAGETVTLIADVNENVTVAANVTIDGAGKNYTGTMTVNNSLTVTIQNVNFVKGSIAENSGNSGNLTIKGCTFDGDNGIGYAITVRGANKLTIENSTAKNYSYGMLYIPSAVASISVKDVTVENVAAAFNISYSGDGTFENVTVKNATYGLSAQNHGSRIFTLKNWTLENVTGEAFRVQDKKTAKVTFRFEGCTEVPVLPSSQYAIIEGATVDGTNYYGSVQGMVEKAVTGQTVKLLSNIAMTEADCVAGADRKVLVDVAGKDITLDMNGKTISVVHEDAFTNDYIVAVVRVADGAGLTVTGEGTIDVKTLDINPDIAYMFWKRGTTGHLTIKNGTYKMNDSADSMVYTNGNEIVTIEGGTWELGAYGTRENRQPWIFNVQGAGDNHVIVKGGTFNADINRQHWSNEVLVPETYYTVANADSTAFTVKEGAKAYVNEGMLTGPYFVRKNIGYPTFVDAVAGVDKNETITLLEDVTLESVVTTETDSITIDLNEKTVTGADGAVVFNIKADATIKNGTILGNKSGTTSGLIDIYANLAMDGVTLETSKINALRFKAGDCTATLDNCNITGAFKGYGGSVWAINSGTYKAASTSINDQLNGTAQISGGTFHYEITDEECAPGYSVVNNGDGTYTVKYAPVCFVDTNNNGTLDEGETVYGSLAAVFNTIKEGDVYIVLTSNTAIAEQVDTDADAKYYLNTNVAEGVTVDFTFADDWNYVQKMYVGNGVTLNAPYLLAWTDLEVHGTINTGYLYTTVANVVIAEGGVVNATTGDATVQVKNGAKLTVNGELNTSILNVWAGESKLIVSGDNAKVNAKWVDIWDGTPVVDVENGATLAVENIKASRGGSIEVSDATLAATGTIELGHNGESTGTLTETGNSTITGNIKLTVEGSTVKSDGGLTNITTDLVGYGVVYENGEYKVVALPVVAKIGDVEYYSLQEALNAAAAGTGNVTVEILADVNLTGIDWNPVTVSAAGYPVVTVEGGNHTITGLNDMLFHSTWAGNSGLIIKDLTIANSAIVNDKDDAAGTVGVGAFIGYPQASATITLENCHLMNSSVEGGHWTGGLIGMAGGYNGNDGPVFMNLTIKGCSVTGSTITGKGSVGGVIGHGSCAAWTNVVIEETTVEGNTIKSTGSSTNKAGAVMGTIGAAGQSTTANGETKTGGASVSATVAGNTVTSNGTEITTIYGRQGTATGKLYVAGGSYDNYPIEQGVAYAAPIEGYEIVQNTDGTYGIQEIPAYVAKIGEQGYETLAAALSAANDGETVTLVWADGDAPIAMNGSVFGKNVTITGTATVDWSKGFLFVGRGGEGNATVTFDGASLTSASDQASTGIHVSGREKDTSNKYDGTLVIKNSTIELDYLINKNTMSLDNSTLTVKNGFSIGGRPAGETESGADATATISLANNSKVIVNNHNGMGLGYEAIGVMNIDATSTFEATQAFLVTAKGTMNVAAGGAVSVNGTLTVNGTLVSAGNIAATIAAGTGATIEISGGVYTQDVNEWCVENYAALPDLNGNYVVGVKPTATVNNLGQMTIPAGGYTALSGGNGEDMPLSFVMQFLADQDAEDMATSPYADWYGDFVITFTGLENGSASTEGCYLAGYYGDFGWVKVPVEGLLTTIENEVRYPVMLGVGAGQKYDYICSEVKDFRCAMYLPESLLEANPNLKVKLELAVVDNSIDADAAANALVNNDKVYSVAGHEYDAEDFVVDPNYIAELIIDDAEGEPYTNDTEKTVGKLTYVRTLPAAGIWYPVFLPFDVPVSALDAELFDVARINDFHTNFSEEDGSIEKMWVEYIVRKSGTFAAGMPFLVRAKNSNVLEMVIELEDVTLYPADKKSTITVGSVITDVTFEGVYESLDAPVSTPSTRYLAVNAAGVWDEFDGYSLNPFRVMMKLQILDEEYYISSAASLSVGARVIGEENEDGTTTIYDVEVDRENCEDMIFDLQGRRVLEPEKGCIYIKNGKKIIF